MDDDERKQFMLFNRFCLLGEQKVMQRQLIDHCVQAGLCLPPPFGCGSHVIPFSGTLDEHEYRIGGLCQRCQDFVFGGIYHLTSLHCPSPNTHKACGPYCDHASHPPSAQTTPKTDAGV